MKKGYAFGILLTALFSLFNCERTDRSYDELYSEVTGSSEFQSWVELEQENYRRLESVSRQISELVSAGDSSNINLEGILEDLYNQMIWIQNASESNEDPASETKQLTETVEGTDLPDPLKKSMIDYFAFVEESFGKQKQLKRVIVNRFPEIEAEEGRFGTIVKEYFEKSILSNDLK